MKADNKTISIISSQRIRESDSLFPSIDEIATKSCEVDHRKTKENFSGFAKMLAQTVNELPEIFGSYQVDSVALSLAVNDHG